MRRICTLRSSRTRRGTASSGSSDRGNAAPPSSNLLTRILTAAVGIPVVFYVDYVGSWPFAALIAAAGAIAVIEFYIMMRAGDYRPALHLGTPAVIAITVLPIAVTRPQAAWIGVLVLLTLLVGGWYLIPGWYDAGLGGWLTTMCGALYVGVLLGHLSLLRTLDKGAWWVATALVLNWAYDTGAYFAGSYLGKTPFMRHVSSKKTLEGVGGGLLLSTLAGLLAVPTVGLAPWQAVLLGLAVGVVAQTGDLVESMIKRHVGVKDSGSIIPGHGGMLDRIDSLLFTGALTYYAAALFGHVP